MCLIILRKAYLKRLRFANTSKLDTLYDASASTWEKTLAIAGFVARNIPHANQQMQPRSRNAINLWEFARTVEPGFNCRLHSILTSDADQFWAAPKRSF